MLLGGRFGYFLFFLLFRRREKGSVRGEKGGGYLFKNGEGERVSEEGRQGGAHWGWEGVAGRGGGGNIFFSGPKCPPRL